MFPLSFKRLGLAMIVLAVALGAFEWFLGTLGASKAGKSLGSTILLVGVITLWPWRGTGVIRWMLDPKKVVGEPTLLDRAFRALESVSPSQVKRIGLVVFEDDATRAITLGTRHRSLVAISTGAMKTFHDADLRALFAHEIGHLVAGHSPQFYLVLASLFLAKMLFGGFGLPIAMFLLVVFLYMLRSNEFEADRLAADVVGAEEMAQFLGRLEGVTGSGKWSHTWWAELISTHPRYSRRIERVMASGSVEARQKTS